MRTTASLATTALLGLALLPGSARAGIPKCENDDEVRVTLLWTDSDNPAAEGIDSASLGALPGDTVVLGIFLDLPTSQDTLTIYGVSLRFDSELGDALDFGAIDPKAEATGEPAIVELDFPGCVGDPPDCNISAGVASFEDSGPAQMGEILTFEGNARYEDPGLQGPGMFAIGQVEFVVTQNLGVAGTTVMPGFFNPAPEQPDNLSNADFCPVANPVFLPARVDLLPEPAAAALGLSALATIAGLQRVRRRTAGGASEALH